MLSKIGRYKYMTATKRCIVTIGIVLIIISGCSYDESKKGVFMKNYNNSLTATDPQKIDTLKQGSEDEKKAIEKFNEFYRVFSEERIRKSIRDLYGENAYFRDGFREVQGIDNIEKYFISSTETFHECTFDIQDVASNGGNYYFRWVMNLILKKNKNDKFQAVGMSHVRFDKNGKITFHQDYWDTGIILEKIPVLGSIITWIRNRI
jgi:limonene-1,2-epoxide hydrolase